jgi:FkbM family methyltransferase
MGDATVLLRRAGLSLLLPRDDPSVFYETWLMNVYGGLHLRRGDIVLDAGASIGDFAVFAARAVGEEGRVIAVEPNPETFALLLENIQLNHLTNVLPVRCALTDRDGSVLLEGSRVVLGLSSEEGRRVVRGARLDTLLAELGIPKITALKMDIEGHELSALCGEEAVLHLREAVIEVHSERLLHDVSQLLGAAGFSVSRNFGESAVRTGLLTALREWPWILSSEVNSRFYGTRRVLGLIVQRKPPVLFDSGQKVMTVILASRPS